MNSTKKCITHLKCIKYVESVKIFTILNVFKLRNNIPIGNYNQYRKTNMLKPDNIQFFYTYQCDHAISYHSAISLNSRMRDAQNWHILVLKKSIASHQSSFVL